MKKILAIILLLIAFKAHAQPRIWGTGGYKIRNNAFVFLGTSGTDSVGRIDSLGIRWMKPVRPGSYTTGAAPTAANFPGYIIYNTDSSKLQFSNGSAWANISQSGGSADGNGIYTGSGSLSGNTTVSGGGSNNLALGATGSKLTTFNVNASGNIALTSDARIFLTGNITYQAVNHTSDANLTVAANTGIVELSSGSLTADRTITLPTATTHGQVITIVVRSTTSSNHYVLSAAVPDVKTGSTFTQLDYGTTYDFMVNASTSWMLIRKY